MDAHCGEEHYRSLEAVGMPIMRCRGCGSLMGDECENCEGRMYTIDDFLDRLQQLKAEHGGNTHVVVPTAKTSLAYEHASVSVTTAASVSLEEGGEIYRQSDNGEVVVVVE